MISIVMSVYNEDEKILERAIESIIYQSYKDWEFIIVLDNPQNIKLKKLILSKINDCNKIILIENKENIGLPKSLNKAIKLARGKYIARMDADDISMPERLNLQLNYIKQGNYDLVGSNMSIFTHDESCINCTTLNPQSYDAIKKILKFENCVPHPTWIVRKEVYEQLNYYRNIHTCEDYDFLLRAVMNGYKLGMHNNACLKYRYNNNSISRTNAAKQQCIRQQLSKAYRKNKVLSEKDLQDYLTSKRGINEIKKISKYYKNRENIKKYSTNKKIFKLIFSIVNISKSKYFYIRRINNIKFKMISKLDNNIVVRKG